MISKKMLVNMRIKIPLKYTLPITQLCQNITNLENLSEAVTFENTGQCSSRNSLIKNLWKGTSTFCNFDCAPGQKKGHNEYYMYMHDNVLPTSINS